MENSLEEICKQKYLYFIKEHLVMEDELTFEGRKRLLSGIILNEAETVECVAGIASASLGFNTRKGLLVATNERILLLLKKGLGGTETSTFYFNRISSIGYKSTMTYSDVKIYTDGEKEQSFNTEKPQIISTILQNLLSKYRDRPDKKKEKIDTSNVNIVEQMEKLFQLKQGGALSEIEYEEMKKKIINS